jgi:ribosomal protein S18 acetylase RimI-like enzyme
MVKEWEHSSVFGDTKDWIREVTQHSPSVCIENKDGDPVAWAIQHEYGCIGMLQVIPEYRRANLGSVVTMLMAQKIHNKGDNLYSSVAVDNHVSLAFHEKNGFDYLSGTDTAYVHYGLPTICHPPVFIGINSKI